MLNALERGLEKYGLDFYLVGAVARDVWMRGIHNLPPRRTTGDIDLAVLINDKGVYEALKKYLVAEEKFQATRENAFVLIWNNRLQVDLLPFGAIEDAEGRVTVQGTGYTTVDVPGFKEIYQQGLPEVSFRETRNFKVCTLPGIVILKLLAWHDRPEARRDDIKDISDILHHFFDMYDEDIWNNHSELFNNEADLKWIAARVMGREIKKVTLQNEKLHQRIMEIFNSNTANAADSKIAAIMVEYFNNTAADNVLLLQQVKTGLEE